MVSRAARDETIISHTSTKQTERVFLTVWGQIEQTERKVRYTYLDTKKKNKKNAPYNEALLRDNDSDTTSRSHDSTAKLDRREFNVSAQRFKI